MANLTVLETIHRLYISLTAMGFNLVLCVMLWVFERDDKNRNKRFVQLALIVLAGNIISCISVVLRRTDVMHPTVRMSVITYMASTLVNVYVTYYFARYSESYFSKWVKPARAMVWINRLILIAITASAVILCAFVPELLYDPVRAAGVASWVRLLYGYAMELYNILYTIIFFAIHRKYLNRRSFITAIIAFSVTVGGIVSQIIFPDVLVNYFGAVIGLYMFYFGVEAPDYKKLMETLSELEAAREEADRANKSKSYFLANMSHEIRTPINAVLGMNEMIIRESTDENITGYARNVESSGKNLLSIINDILDFSKIEAGRLELINASYRPDALIRDIVNMISYRSESKGLKLDVKVDENIPSKLYGDEVRIRQIIINLLTNAVKYTEEGTVSLEVSGEMKDGFRLRVSVRDTGIGIRKEDIGNLFTQFRRVDPEHNKTIEGTGLGLAITKDLVDMMGGDISVNSEYGSGSVFAVTLPQKVVSEAPIGPFDANADTSSVKTEAYREAFRAPTANVLVVDDTKINLKVVSALLKKTEINVDTASGGQAGIDMAMEKAYDVIFMDQRMPQIDGTMALQEIRSSEGPNKATPIICLTADAISGAREKYLADGFNDYLTKPIEGGAMENMLIQYLPPEKIQRTAENEQQKHTVISENGDSI